MLMLMAAESVLLSRGTRAHCRLAHTIELFIGKIKKPAQTLPILASGQELR